jgi:hypothetical protein
MTGRISQVASKPSSTETDLGLEQFARGFTLAEAWNAHFLGDFAERLVDVFVEFDFVNFH